MAKENKNCHFKDKKLEDSGYTIKNRELELFKRHGIGTSNSKFLTIKKEKKTKFNIHN